MREQHPWPYYAGGVAKVFATAAILAGAYVFFFHERYERLSNLVKLQVEERVATATEDLQVELLDLQAELTEAQADKAESEADIYKGKAKASAAPRLQVNHSIDEGSELRGVRQLRLRVEIENIGTPSVDINKVGLQIFAGNPSEGTADVLQKTQELHGLFSKANQLAIQLGSGYAMEQVEYGRMHASWQQLTLDYDTLHEDCPHGQLFSVSKENDHFDWMELPEHARDDKLDVTLHSEQVTSLDFVYVLTESFDHHANWFRFVLTVNPGQEPSPQFEMIEPMMSVPSDAAQSGGYAAGVSTMSKKSYRTKYLWKPIFRKKVASASDTSTSPQPQQLNQK